jgi:hypothetical protein
MAISRFKTSSVAQGLPKYQKFWDGVSQLPGAYESIATVTVGSGGSSSIDFTSIPSTYKHLQLKAFARTNAANTESYLQLQYNGDTGTNYYGQHWIAGNGSSATSNADGAASVLYVERITAANTTASIFGSVIIDILDYANNSKYKTNRNLGAYDGNGAGVLKIGSGLWLSTSTISSIKITPALGSFVQYSSFALYGIKG